ncbi:MAG TPA: FlxA-like family protein [Acidobacteriota bacterium]|nr:FlxA-like family protein [Acidobacteriota bacterium]
MPRHLLIFVLLFLIFTFHNSFSQQASSDVTLEQLKLQLESLKADYEERIKNLETQIEQLQIQMLQAPEPESAQAPASQVQSFPGILNPAIAVVGNFVGRADDQEVFNEEGDAIDDKLNLREAELDFRTAIDPYADGVLIASLESEFPGEFNVGVEEGYVTLKKLPFFELPLGMKFKVGRFRPVFGKTNILHTHDLPQTFRPLPVEEFLGEEGFVQNGLSTNFFIPTPWDENASLDATVELMDGGEIALSPQSDSRISYLGHLRYFRTFADAHNFELGWTAYFHPSGNGIGTAHAEGLDLLYIWKPLRQGQWKSYIIGGELMFAPKVTVEEDPLLEQSDRNTPLGFTLFNQYQFDRRTYAGIRYDATDTLLNPDLQRRSITPYVSYYFSEFLRFRVNYEHRWSDLLEEDGRDSIFLELNWIFGSHPPEPFWVNK